MKGKIRERKKLAKNLPSRQFPVEEGREGMKGMKREMWGGNHWNTAPACSTQAKWAFIDHQQKGHW
jgi:hypothetical protein